ncbi:unnamed protein product [Sphenostylis stenocarpa]|uniref:Uncharacterized protein n=1 Tax=Sphenostylis stenocarpa TaxID=92480 RepID=A0AA86SFG9_9FABA|nr:unnamed protein product [Sphenostylis stenocarpa]
MALLAIKIFTALAAHWDRNLINMLYIQPKLTVLTILVSGLAEEDADRTGA